MRNRGPASEKGSGGHRRGSLGQGSGSRPWRFRASLSETNERKVLQVRVVAHKDVIENHLRYKPFD